MWKGEIVNFDVVLAAIKYTVLGNRCTSNAGLFFDLRLSTIRTFLLHFKWLSMIISESYFGVAILVMQQSFLRMEIKWIQKISLCTVGNIIQFLKTTINLEKHENPIFSIRLASASDLSSLYEWLLLPV